MKHSAYLWIIAFLLTAVTAYYQRVTGPSYPLTGTTFLGNTQIRYSLPRSHGGESPAAIQIQAKDSTVQGYVQWKRFKIDDPWMRATMVNRGGTLTAELPHQPPAGKIQYSLTLSKGNEVAVVPNDELLVIRFKGDVPVWILIPHIVAMFASMLLAARAGLEYFNEKSNLQAFTYWTLGCLIVGGFVFGPMVQYHAFHEWWTGWPLGTDLTDTKTAVILLAWIGVVYALRRSKNPRTWALAASIITFAVFLIPHSLLGSELDYKTLDRQNTGTDTVNVR